MNPALAREEAFLRDVVEGRIRAESSCSDSPRKRDIPDSGSAQASSTQRRSENDRACGSEIERILDAIDNLCTPKKSANAPDGVSDESDVNCPMQSAFLSFLDSGSEDEDVKRSPNDFLHLTSSEIELMEINGMKEVLRMQGIWMFNWDRCAEVGLSKSTCALTLLHCRSQACQRNSRIVLVCKSIQMAHVELKLPWTSGQSGVTDIHYNKLKPMNQLNMFSLTGSLLLVHHPHST